MQFATGGAKGGASNLQGAPQTPPSEPPLCMASINSYTNEVTKRCSSQIAKEHLGYSLERQSTVTNKEVRVRTEHKSS